MLTENDTTTDNIILLNSIRYRNYNLLQSLWSDLIFIQHKQK